MTIEEIKEKFKNSDKWISDEDDDAITFTEIGMPDFSIKFWKNDLITFFYRSGSVCFDSRIWTADDFKVLKTLTGDVCFLLSDKSGDLCLFF